MAVRTPSWVSCCRMSSTVFHVKVCSGYPPSVAVPLV
ncbi:Uncharacterised protein [Mycobacteroides abscessus subsp. abscessus]|nr:Uncharacterised protein [Mycobacteroides abscessus subsp. abscessus]